MCGCFAAGLTILSARTAYEENLAAIERNLERLFHMQRDTDEILRTSQELEAASLPDEIDRLKVRLEDLGEVAARNRSVLAKSEEMGGTHGAPRLERPSSPSSSTVFSCGRRRRPDASRPIVASTCRSRAHMGSIY